jgi:membrane protein DedA with SNARE-associated domain
MPGLELQDWLKLIGEFYDRYGYLTVFLGSLGENTAFLGLLLPGNSLALLGAVYARIGTLNLGWVIFFASIGTVLGYHIDYFFGRLVLARTSSRWSASRIGRRMRLAGRLRLARILIAKHGGKAILISHLIGHLRSFVALSAGMSRMNYRRFLGYELVAAAVWNTAFCLLGYLLAGEIDRLQVLIERAGLVIVGVLVLLFIGWRFLKQRVRQRIRQERREARRRASSEVLR